MKSLYGWVVLMVLAAGELWASETAEKSVPAREGGIEVFTKIDFSVGMNPFMPAGKANVALVDEPTAGAGRCLLVRRTAPGGYFGSRVANLSIHGSRDLKIAFCVAGKGLEQITVNFFDALAKDNTTPRSPARVQDGRWRTVVLAVEDFRYNSEPPQKRIRPDNHFESLLFHGQESPRANGQFWIDRLVIYRGQDTQPPAAPAGLRAETQDAGRVALSWQVPSDNAFAAVYGIFRKGGEGHWIKAAESILPCWIDTVPIAGTYTYRVTAADYDNNVSQPSAGVTVRVPSAGTGVPVSPQVEDRLRYADHVSQIHAAGRGKVRHDVVLFAGDSITAADAYTFILGGWLGRGIPVREGVGGVRTAYGKSRIGSYLTQHRPEYAVIMYGTNDSKSPQAVEAARGNLSAIIEACVRAGTVPILATIPPRGYDKSQQDDQVRFNEALVRLCRERHVPVSYCFEEMMQRNLKELLGDGVHLTPNPGNNAAGAALWKTFNQIEFALRDPTSTWD